MSFKLAKYRKIKFHILFVNGRKGKHSKETFVNLNKSLTKLC